MAISVKDLTKMYGPQAAIDGISFTIESGEIVGFLGPNGAGKTTTMKIITCFMEPSSGTVEMDEYNIHEHSLQIRERIGYLPEHNPLYLDMYVHEFLEFAGRLYRRNVPHLQGAGLRKRVAEVIDMTGLGREQHKQLGMLSKGYRQRVGLAQALLHDPPVLILDEPTTGLDPNQIVEIRSLIREIGKEKTILFSTHILPEVEAIAGRVLIINMGKIVADVRMDDLREGRVVDLGTLVEFRNPEINTGPFEAMEGVKRVIRREDGKYLISTEPEVDVRALIFDECVRQSNTILEMRRVQPSLEDIFRKYTRVGKADEEVTT